MSIDLLDAPVASTAETLTMFGRTMGEFEADYRAAIQAVLALERPTTLCTIYNGNLDEPTASLARVALTTFNDVILRVAFEHRLSLIDLRLVCCDAEDYANPIEPSGRGGEKIARAIVRALQATEGRHSRVYST
jgi:hypothetical protein